MQITSVPVPRQTPVRRLAAGAVAVLTTLVASVGATGSAVADRGPSGGDLDVTLTSSRNLDPAQETVTLPLFRGTHAGRPVYYVLTDSSDRDDAARRGLDWAPKLAHALGTAAVQRVTSVGGVLDFPGIVDFRPTRVVRPGPSGSEFVGGTFAPGAVGDAAYSPLITTGNGVVLNATQVADDSGVHDSVVSLDTSAMRVTLKTFFGLWNGHRTVYLHLDASSPEVAAAEGSNLARNLDAAPGLGSNDTKTSARSAIIPVVNGATGVGNPDRQGLNSALRGEGDPININQDIPGQGNGRYSPVWDVHPVVWTQAAIAAGRRRLLVSGSDVANAYTHGWVTPAGSGPANKDLGGLPAGGFISNCPIVAVG